MNDVKKNHNRFIIIRVDWSLKENWGRSLVINRKIVVSNKTEPCGTPKLKGWREKEWSCITTAIDKSDMKFEIKIKRKGLKRLKGILDTEDYTKLYQRF